MAKRNRVITFVPIIALATLFSCITAVKRVANDVENSSGKAKRCHSGRLVSEAKLFVTKVETNKAKMLEPKHSNVLV